jgi:hypothetical protein
LFISQKKSKAGIPDTAVQVHGGAMVCQFDYQEISLEATSNPLSESIGRSYSSIVLEKIWFARLK